MKKVMFVLVSLLIVSTCFALESGPSNKVGYVKIAVPGQANLDVFTPFGLPFVFWDVPAGNVPTYGVASNQPSDIVGTQANCGSPITTPRPDRIIRQGTGDFAQRTGPAPYTNCTWGGALETGVDSLRMIAGRAYYYRNSSGANRNLVLAGEADTTAVGIRAVLVTAPALANQSAFTAYSWRDPRIVARDRLNLRAQGFTGGVLIPTATADRVLEQSIAAPFFYYRTTDNTWQGTLTQVVPGVAYYIVNRHVGHPWTYTYNASGAQLTNDDGDLQINRVVVPTTKSSVGSKHSSN